MAFYSSFSIDQQIYQGSGCIQVIPDILKKEGWQRVLIVCGPSLLKTGAIKAFETMLTDAGCEYAVFSDVKPNPLISDVETIGVPMARELKAEVLLAIGGGSTMDSAKGIAILGDSGKTIMDIAGTWGKYPPHDPLPWKTLPLIAVPTTCGTGSEVLRNAVLSEADGHKIVPMHDCIIPTYAVCDPDLLATLPRHVAAASGMDALVQAIEGTVSLAASDFARTCGFRAVELIGPVLRRYVNNPADSQAADAMSKGCMYAGLCWNNSFPAQNHGSNHPVTEQLKIPHGNACAMIMPWFVERNGEACQKDFFRIYNYMVPDAPMAEADFAPAMLVEEFKKLNHDIGIAGRMMKEAGCTEEICAKLTETFVNLPFYPVSTEREDMTAAFIDIMNGKYDL